MVLDDSVGSLDEQEKEEDEFTYELPSKHTSFVVGDRYIIHHFRGNLWKLTFY